jgi:phosphate:Na+ symporter
MNAGAGLNLVEIFGLLIGGLALFLFGLELMTGGLKNIAGPRLQTLMSTLTSSRLRGVLAGAGITALLNSSSITTVLMVGFVSAELMTLRQAIPMIMGANIGSTVTAQIIAFNISAITPYLLAGGFLLHGFAKRELTREAGSVALGLGLLFMGIELMSDATRPMRDYEPFIALMQDMRNPVLGIVIGAVFTAIVQSSAATLAVVIALGSQGLIPLESGIALIFGANVGTCGTALLASLGKSAQALQVGIVHLLFNLMGVLFFVFVIPQFADFARYISPSSPELQGAARLAAEMPRQAANAHTVFSVFGTAVLIWFTGPIARLAERLAPKPRKERREPGAARYLDESLTAMPALAIARVQLELVELGMQIHAFARRSALLAAGMETQDPADLAERNQEVDQLCSAILNYVGGVSESSQNESESQQLIALARIATHLDTIRELATANMYALERRRLSQGAPAALPRDAEGLAFAKAVLDHLTLAIQTIVNPSAEAVARVVDAKPALAAQAEAVQHAALSQAQLRKHSEAINFRMANDMIEHFNEIARLSRSIAKATQPLNAVKVSDNDPA